MTSTGFRNPDCTLCPLYAGATNVCIEGDGNPNAPIWIIGEAPGYNEDKENRAFVGGAGAELREELDNAGFSTDDVFLTNAVRCRPPKNRKPTSEELKVCSSTYLMKEIEHFKPQYIVPAGNTPLQAVMGRAMSITRARGNPMTLPITKKVKHVKKFKNGNEREMWRDEVVHEATVFPIFHPSYACLRNPAARPLFVADLHNLKRILSAEGSEDNVQYIPCTTPEQVLDAYMHLKDSDVLSFDLETYGQPDAYDPRNEDFKILSCAISAKPGTCYVIAVEHPDNPLAQDPRYVHFCRLVLKKLLERDVTRPQKRIIAHNGLYDCYILAGHFGIDVHLTFDTMVMAFLLNENEPKTLKRQAPQWLGVKVWNDGIVWTETVRYKDDDGRSKSYRRMIIPPWETLWPYNAKDTDYTLQLYYNQKQRISNQPKLIRLFTKLLVPAVKALVKIQLNGLCFDRERVIERIEQTVRLRQEQEAIILSYVPEDRRATFNVNTPVDLRYLLYDVRGLPIQLHPKTKKPTTDKEALTALEDSVEQDSDDARLMKAIREYRKWAKYDSTYLHKWYLAMTPDGWVFPKYNLCGKESQGGGDSDDGVVTGRLSGDYQQIPRDVFLRSCVSAPLDTPKYKGWKWLQADLSQVELRLVAHEAGDPNLIDAYRTGKDVHTMMARKLLEMRGTDPDSVSPDEFKRYRTLAKGVNFGFLYGMEWPKFIRYMRTAFNATITPEEAKAARQAFFDMWPRIAHYHRQQRQKVETYKKVESLIGRVRRLPDIDSDDKSVRENAVRQAINSPIQSLGSDIMLLGMIEVAKEIEGKEDEIIMVMTFHDALGFYVRPDVAEEWGERIQYLMANPPLKEWFGVELLVPLAVDYEISTHWTEHD